MFGTVEQKAESAQERGREAVRARLAKHAEPLVHGLGLTTKRNKGESFELRPMDMPRKSSRELPTEKPVTFDGFEAAGLSVDEIKDSFGDLLGQMASSVRFSLQPVVKIIDGKFIVATFVEQPVGHVRIDILSMSEHEMPSKQDILDLLKFEAGRVMRWRDQGISAEEASLVLASRANTRTDWINAAVNSLLTHKMSVEEAQTKAAHIVDDVIASRKRV